MALVGREKFPAQKQETQLGKEHVMDPTANSSNRDADWLPKFYNSMTGGKELWSNLALEASLKLLVILSVAIGIDEEEENW